MKTGFKKFLESLDLREPNERVAKSYLGYFENLSSLHGIAETKKNNNISIVSDSNSFEFITKRLPLISDTGILSYKSNSGGGEIYRTYKKYEEWVFDDGNTEVSWDYLYVDSPEFKVLGQWIKSCRELLMEGDIVFIPRFTRDSYFKWSGTNLPTTEPIINKTEPFIDAIVKNKKIVELKTNNFVKSKYITPILEIDLPIIDNVDLKTFSKVATDEKSQIDLLRIALREIFLEIDISKGSEQFFTDLEKLNIKISKEIESISRAYKQLSRKRAFQISGSSVASIVATLVAVDSTLFEAIGEIIGTSGGLYLFLDSIRDNNLSKSKIRENPFYFFWFIENEKKK